MKCNPDQIEINGKCQSAYMQGDLNLDGTPDVPGSSSDNSKWGNKFGNFFEKYGQVITGTAIEILKTNQGGQTEPQPLPAATPAQNNVPTWVWVAGILVFVALVVFVIRSRKK